MLVTGTMSQLKCNGAMLCCSPINVAIEEVDLSILVVVIKDCAAHWVCLHCENPKGF